MKEKLKLVLLLVVLLGIIVISHELGERVVSMDVKEEKIKIVVDPGHGGADPGKVGVNGALEKDINLEIAKKVKAILEKENVHIIMTREDENGLYDEADNNKKLADMQKRVEIIETEKPQLVVSIHQNSFSDNSVKGPQVFYHAQSQEGEQIALVLQNELNTLGAERSIKANDSYYMLKKTTVPTIIVECGFLSNEEEAEMLTQEEYQEQVAQAICSGIIKWLDKSVE